MYALNRVKIIGHLTEDPQVRQTPNGQTVGDLNIVTKQTFLNSSGQPQQGMSYHSIVVWRGLADISSRFLRKGSQVFISGRIQTDEWEDQQTGQKRYKTRVVADEMILLDPKNPNPPLGADSLVGGGLNSAEVLGNATRDPEIRQTPNGDSVVSFGVATNFSWKDRSGQDQEKTEFHNIVAWGDLAKTLAENVKKGRKVYIAGRLQTRSWETPEGNKRYATEIIAERALALGVPDSDIGVPAIASSVSVSEPQIKTEESVVPENPTEVPAVNYESEVKPEDLPF
ncbi:single-stranded DNA-binding protein [Patescibacteria group bacterium]|nr:single-stranded DNA-binding protein [Patescibacteria group bacterium]MBU1935726.1 single-stranded DNA-binding protein [Patescibacteria group bacterium]